VVAASHLPASKAPAQPVQADLPDRW